MSSVMLPVGTSQGFPSDVSQVSGIGKSPHLDPLEVPGGRWLIQIRRAACNLQPGSRVKGEKKKKDTKNEMDAIGLRVGAVFSALSSWVAVHFQRTGGG